MNEAWNEVEPVNMCDEDDALDQDDVPAVFRALVVLTVPLFHSPTYYSSKSDALLHVP